MRTAELSPALHNAGAADEGPAMCPRADSGKFGGYMGTYRGTVRLGVRLTGAGQLGVP